MSLYLIWLPLYGYCYPARTQNLLILLNIKINNTFLNKGNNKNYNNKINNNNTYN